MPDNRLTRNLQAAGHQGRTCLMPYITAGYPNLDTTVKLLERFDALGCQAVEIGFPFSDSIADGPVIQDSFHRVLENGFHVEELFEAVAATRNRLSAALLAMVSVSIVHRWGMEALATRAAASGFDGLIVPDVPVDECRTLAQVADSHNLCNVLMCAPTSSADRRRQIAERSTGFIYVIAARGLTGERSGLAGGLAEDIGQMRKLTATPLVVGFGIHTVEQVRAVGRVADGVIVGSAIIRRMAGAIEQHCTDEEIANRIGQYVEELIAGT